MAWVVIPNTDIDADSPITVALMTALRDNIAAAFAKDSGAPQLAAGYVTNAMMASASVSQGNLKATNGAVSTGISTGNNLTLPGGLYGFYPQTRVTSGSASVAALVGAKAQATSYTTQVWLKPSAGITMYAQQRYVQASPPYDLGNGEVPIFVFLLVEKASGAVVSAYVAQDPPWANNGPTKSSAEFYGVRATVRGLKRSDHIVMVDTDTGKAIRAPRRNEKRRGFRMRYKMPHSKKAAMRSSRKMRANLDAMAYGPVPVEITQTIKQADMALIPHPFSEVDLTTHTVVMLDPNDKFTMQAYDMAEAFSEGAGEVSELIHESGFFKVDSTPISGLITPPGVVGVRGSLR